MDRIAEKYHGALGGEWEVKISRDRIHWMVQWTRGPRVLDWGCGQGISAKLVREKGYDVVGYDVDPSAIAYAREHYPDITFTTNEAEIAGAFDTILLGEVVEHQEEPRRFLERVIARLRSGGRAIITVPHGYNDCLDHRHLFTMTSIIELIEPLLGVVSLDFQDGFIRLVGTNEKTDWKPTLEIFKNAELDMIELHKRERARAEVIQNAHDARGRELVKLHSDFVALANQPYVRYPKRLSRFIRRATGKGE